MSPESRPRKALRLAIVAVVVSCLHSVPAIGEPISLHASARLQFSGRSTLHGFEGHAAPLTFPIKLTAPNQYDASVTVPVRSMSTDNSTRDAKMWAMFDAERWPQIEALFVAVDPAGLVTSGQLPFRLTIRDVSRDMVAAVTSWQQQADQVSFDATFDVSLAAFGLTAPSVLALVRVADSVAVTVHVVVAPVAPES